MGTDAAGGRKLLLREGGSILDILERTGLGLLVPVVVAVEAVEAERSSGTLVGPAELVGDDRPSFVAVEDPNRGGEGKGREEAATVL